MPDLTLSLADLIADPVLIIPVLIVLILVYGAARAARSLSDSPEN